MMKIKALFLFCIILGTSTSFAKEMRLYFGPAPEEARAIVVWLHGCLQSNDHFVKFTRLEELIHKEKLIVIAPNQSVFQNPIKCWNWFGPKYLKKHNAFFKTIINSVDSVQKRFRLENVPVVVGGFSAGGVMASHLALCYPEVFSAAMVHSGGPYNLIGRALGSSELKECEKKFISSETEKKFQYLFIVHGKKDGVAPFFLSQKTYEQFISLREKSQYNFHIERLELTRMGHGWSGSIPFHIFSYPKGPNVTKHFIQKVPGTF